MKYQSDYEKKLESLVEEWDARIESLEAEARNAGPELKRKYEEAIERLILDREAARRGLLRVEESEELCSSCPPESGSKDDSPPEDRSQDVEGVLDRILYSALDITEGPRTVYGRENP